MDNKRFALIEETLTPDDMAVMDQWATAMSEGRFDRSLTLKSTVIVLDKLWYRFDADLVNAWSESLVEAKRQASEAQS